MVSSDNGLIRKVLEETRTIAVVGLSSRPERAGYYVPAYLQEQGYRIIPVNPYLESEVLGERPYPDLASVPEPFDLVLLFRKSEAVPPFVEEAIRIGAKAVWMQLGIAHPEAAERARAAGLDVVMDRCILVEHRVKVGDRRAENRLE
jgi:predicted CoA-binding protein